MINTKSFVLSAAFLSTILLSLSPTSCAQAQAVDLIGLGINADFESEDVTLNEEPSDATEQYTTADMGPGWTFTGNAGENYGVQNPAEGFFGAQSPLPAPFNGRMMGFMNLHTPLTGSAEIESLPVGAIKAGEVYTLTVAVGARLGFDWILDYEIGLRTVGGDELGFFALEDNFGAVSGALPVDLVYTLDVDTEAAAYIGQDVGIVIRSTNQSNGFAQSAFDNVRLDGEFSTSIVGDFDTDGDVDGADFLDWQRGFNSIYDAGHLADWEANYGAGGAMAASSISAVPEPATGFLAILGCILAAGGKRRQRS